MSVSSKSKVFLFGATGHLGADILHFLTTIPATPDHSNYAQHFQVTALVRADTLDSKEEKKSAAVAKLKASGANLVTGDIQKAEAAEIAKWISGYDIVLSALAQRTPGPIDELKLLEAVKIAKVPWYIPALFSSDPTRTVSETLPFLGMKKSVLEAVQASAVKSFFVINYGFTEYVISPLLGVDIANATVTAPYSFDSKISTITVNDIAHLTVEALLHREEHHVKNQTVHFVTNTVSFNEIVGILEEHFKKPFKRVLFTKEQALAAVEADPEFKNIPARFAVVFGNQKGMWSDPKDSWNARHAKHIKLTTLKEYVAALKA